MVALLLFWITVFLVFHSYVLFPLGLRIFANKRRNGGDVWPDAEMLPNVSVVLSVYNEEQVIEQKVRNLLASKYSLEKLELIIGSDASTDKTNEILRKLQIEIPNLQLFLFEQRQGKSSVINRLVEKATGDLLLLTDAKVTLSPEALYQMVRHFRDSQIGIVGGNIVNLNARFDGISVQERMFMSREVMIKYNEGRLWGATMGMYGACYVIRRKLYETIPDGFSVDDFYETMKVYQAGYRGIIELDAVCYENVPNQLEEEFRRKVRISAGNFQNLRFFGKLLLKPGALSFAFFSHKVIRWLGPLFILLAFITNLFLVLVHPFYIGTMWLQVGLMMLPFVDYFLRKNHIHNVPLRFVTHFYMMNLALLVGFLKYLKGAKTNVWEPTTRQY